MASSSSLNNSHSDALSPFSHSAYNAHTQALYLSPQASLHMAKYKSSRRRFSVLSGRSLFVCIYVFAFWIIRRYHDYATETHSWKHRVQHIHTGLSHRHERTDRDTCILMNKTGRGSSVIDHWEDDVWPGFVCVLSLIHISEPT